MKRLAMLTLSLVLALGALWGLDMPAALAEHAAHYACGQTACDHTGHTGKMPTWTEWDGSSFTNAMTYYVYLTSDVTLNAPIMIGPGTHVNLCLGGHDLTVNGSDCIVRVTGISSDYASFTLCDCTGTPGSMGLEGNGAMLYPGVDLLEYTTFTLYGGTITECGVGVRADNHSAQFDMYGGAVDGAFSCGVRVASDSIFQMWGGEVRNTQSGFGVEVLNFSRFNLFGGSIKGNSGGVRVNGSGADVFMYDGSIEYNSGEYGGVYLKKGTFTMNGGSIEGNTAKRGGGVCADAGTFKQNGGAIQNNSLSADGDFGGGVYLLGGKYEMSGGSISGNRAMRSGGGVYCNAADLFTMTGPGQITGNNARESAGGIRAYDLYITGDGARITDNSVGGFYSSTEVSQQRASNIFLPYASQMVELAPSVTSGAFGVTCVSMSTMPHPFLTRSAPTIYPVTSDIISLFTSDNPYYETAVGTGSTVYGVLGRAAEHRHKPCGAAADASCTHAQDAHASAVAWKPWDGSYAPLLTNATTYLYLTQDNANGAFINVESGKTLYLCLNGHTLERPGNNTVAVSVDQGGHFVLCDCASTPGKLTNGAASQSVLLHNMGTFTMYGGQLTASGSAVTCDNGSPSVNLYGGSITGSSGGYTGNGVGCGIYMRFGTLNMYGGSITGNKSSAANAMGGGVYLGDSLYSATMYMYGGSITGNQLTGSGAKGGGIYVGPRSTLVIKGGSITGNTAAQGGGVYMDSNTSFTSLVTAEGNVTITDNTGGNLRLHAPIVRTGEITGAIGVTVLTVPAEDVPVNFVSAATHMTDAELARFTSDQGYANKRISGSYAQFFVPPTLHDVTVENGTADPAQALKNTTVTLTASAAPAGQEFDHWEVVSGGVTLADANASTTTFTMGGSAVSVKAVYRDKHEHYYCSYDTCADGHARIHYQPWGSSAPVLTSGDNAYYLTKNTTMGALTVENGQTLYLCLNSQTLRTGGVTVKSGGKLVLSAHTLSYLSQLRGAIIVEAGGAVEMYGHMVSLPADGEQHVNNGVMLVHEARINGCVINNGTLTMSSYAGISTTIGSTSPVLTNNGTAALSKSTQILNNHVSGTAAIVNASGAALMLSDVEVRSLGAGIENAGTLSIIDVDSSIHTQLSMSSIYGCTTGVVNTGSMSMVSGQINGNQTGVQLDGGTLTLSRHSMVYGNTATDIHVNGGRLICDGNLCEEPTAVRLTGSGVIECKGDLDMALTVSHDSQSSLPLTIDVLKRTDGSATAADVACITLKDAGAYQLRLDPTDGTLVEMYLPETTYAITYDLAGGVEGTPANPTSYTDRSAAITLVNPTREHYVFAGWTGTGLSSPSTSVTIPAGSTGDRSYTATWTPDQYAVTVSVTPAEGGEATGAGSYAYGSTATLTVQPANGYTLIGWMENGSYVSYDFTYAITVDGARTLTADMRQLALPTFVTHPQDVQVLVGEDAVFTAEALSSDAVTYRWQIDRGEGFYDAGCTQDTFTLSAAALTDNGLRVRCVATTTDGSAYSNVATLTVITPPAGLPATGDRTPVAAAAWLMALSLGGIAIILRRKRAAK